MGSACNKPPFAGGRDFAGGWQPPQLKKGEHKEEKSEGGEKQRGKKRRRRKAKGRKAKEEKSGKGEKSGKRKKTREESGDSESGMMKFKKT